MLYMVKRHCGDTTPIALRWSSMLDAEVEDGMQEW